MRSRANLVLKGPVPSPSTKIEQHKDKTLAGPSGKGVKATTNSAAASYNILDQLQRTNAQISIFELLKISPAHRKILDKALTEENVPQDLDLEWFQSMVGHLTSSYYMSYLNNLITIFFCCNIFYLCCTL